MNPTYFPIEEQIRCQNSINDSLIYFSPPINCRFYLLQANSIWTSNTMLDGVNKGPKTGKMQQLLQKVSEQLVIILMTLLIYVVDRI